IGLGFAARRPELITRLIIGNTWAWPLDREPRVRAFSWLMGGPIGRTLTRGVNFVPRFFFPRGLPPPVTREVPYPYLPPLPHPAPHRPPPPPASSSPHPSPPARSKPACPPSPTGPH